MMVLVYPAMHAAAISAAQQQNTPPSASMSAIEESWSAIPDASLASTLSGWADRAGWKVIWETDTDFRLGAGGTITGAFEAAATQLLDAFGRTRPRLKATFYRGNKVLRVWTERTEP